jgi:hypothetical protein
LVKTLDYNLTARRFFKTVAPIAKQFNFQTLKPAIMPVGFPQASKLNLNLNVLILFYNCFVFNSIRCGEKNR